MKQPSAQERVMAALIISSAASLTLYLAGIVLYNDHRFWFLSWNLFLAWLPLGFMWLLTQHLRRHRWASLAGVGYSLLWLGFLPNSFYIVSDLIHVRYASSTTSLFFIVLIMAFSLTGMMLGYLSLFMVHAQLLKRLTRIQAHAVVAIVLWLCGFAIYLGRYLRWNSWDILINPAGILFDVSDRVINPAAHEQTFRITLLFFILFGSTYWVIWQFVQAIRQAKR